MSIQGRVSVSRQPAGQSRQSPFVQMGASAFLARRVAFSGQPATSRRSPASSFGVVRLIVSRRA
eukprot:1261138-Lingulodinium_polyedra.AAC.1